MAWPTTAIVSAKRSAKLLGRTAASTPSGMASTSAKAMAEAPSDHGDRQPREDHVGDRLAQRVGAAEIAAQRAGEPVEILHGDGPVEAVELADRLDVGGPRALAGDGDGRVAGDIDHREGDAARRSAPPAARHPTV